ncbi:acyl carrier protein [Paraburkholderia youngii]|uniref:acyl carrier protein n=1 Tax=Paraburkholderia youngii TaxID=2782701 RepID=UPI003D24D438
MRWEGLRASTRATPNMSPIRSQRIRKPMQVDKTPEDTAATEHARKLIAQLLCMSEARVSVDQRLLDELAMDSLEILELAMSIRQRNPSVEEGSVIGMDGVKGRRYAAAGGRKRASVLRSRSPRSRPFSSSA